jgi:uncharacterized protein YqeY
MIELGEQLLQRQRTPILVQSQVGVGVDHFRLRRAQPLRFSEERRERAGVERVVHGLHPSGTPVPLVCLSACAIARPAYPDLQMAILEQIKADVQGAMRAGEKDRVGALRLVLSELQKAAKEGSDDELAVLRRERKRRLESARAFREGGREDLAGGEESEAELIGSYLPAELSQQELAAIVEQAVRESGAESAKDMGTAMKRAMAAVDGRADGKRVSELVRAALQG